MQVFVPTERGRLLRLILGVVLLDLLAFSAIIPLFPLLFFDCPHCALTASIPIKARYLLLGLLYATYPLAQAIAAPLWGKYSDRFGRKKTLLYSYCGNTCGYLLCALGLMKGILVLFFLGNLVAGLTGVNFSTLHAVISDHTQGSLRKKCFGALSMLLGLCFALSPFLCGELLRIFSHLELLCTLLLLAAAMLSLVNLWLLYRFLPNYSLTEEPAVADLGQEHPLQRTTLRVIFFLAFGWFCFIKTFQVFLIEKEGIHQANLLFFVSYYGLCLFGFQAFYTSWLHKWFSKPTYLVGLLFLLGLALAALPFSQGYTALLCVIALLTFAYAMIGPSLTALFSETYSSGRHGKMMGQHQSIMAAAKITAPLAAGCLLMIDSSVAIAVSSAAVCTAAVLLLKSLLVHRFNR